MKIIDEVELELVKFTNRLKEYKDTPNSATHSAAKRTSLDLSKLLSKWRKIYINYQGYK